MPLSHKKTCSDAATCLCLKETERRVKGNVFSTAALRHDEGGKRGTERKKKKKKKAKRQSGGNIYNDYHNGVGWGVAVRTINKMKINYVQLET